MADENQQGQQNDNDLDDVIGNVIDDLEGDDPSVSSETSDQGNEQGKEASQDSSTQGDAGRSGSSEKDKAAPGQQQQATSQQAGHSGPQDLTLPDGRVVKGGPERRIYERDAYNAYVQLPQIRQENEQLKSQVEAYKGAFESSQQLGLSPQEVHTAHRLMGMFKKNPIETVQYMLTELRAAGHNIDGIGSAVDTNAIVSAVKQQLSPLLQTHEQQQASTQAYQEAERQWNQFVDRYPLAKVHENTLSQLLAEDGNLSLEVAYYQLENYALRKGLDFSKPLDQQVQAQQQQGNQQGNGPSVNLPNGGRSNQGVQQANQVEEVADENADYRDIIRSAMSDAGLDVSSL